MNVHVHAAIRDRGARGAYVRIKKIAERHVARLRKIARHIGDIIREFDAATPEGQILIHAALQKYRQAIEPWAQAVADRFVAEVAAADKEGWRRMAALLGKEIEREVTSAPVASVMAAMKQEQVRLITSLPQEASERVHHLVVQGLSTGRRASEVAKDIYETGNVTRSRATLIARTETGRAATAFTKARATHIGSTHFIWRTAGDADVRPSHKRLNGRVFAWDDPPECDPGYKALPGSIWNCRCFAEAILLD